MSGRPLISLCVIVKNQAFLLDRLLRRHAGLYDEAVVVDTGSADGSPRVAEDLGARVESFRWGDDFSAARNHSLALARGRWILVLDCDELVAPVDFGPLRELAASGMDTCHVLPQINYKPDPEGPGWQRTPRRYEPFSQGAPGYTTAWSIRLFPGLPSMRYRGTVHECLDRAALVSGLSIRRQAIPIHHHGHLPGMGEPALRTALYGRLLAEKLRLEPSDPRARYEMAVHLAASGRSDLAGRLLQRLLRDHPLWPDSYRAHLLLGEILHRNREQTAADRHFRLALQARPDWPKCWEAVITSQLEAGLPAEARRYQEQARKLFPAHRDWKGFAAQVGGASGR